MVSRSRAWQRKQKKQQNFTASSEQQDLYIPEGKAGSNENTIAISSGRKVFQLNRLLVKILFFSLEASLVTGSR